MCLLMAFNKSNEWTYEELLAETGKSNYLGEEFIHRFRHSRKRVQSGLGVNDYGQDGKSCSAKGHKGRIEKD